MSYKRLGASRMRLLIAGSVLVIVGASAVSTGTPARASSPRTFEQATVLKSTVYDGGARTVDRSAAPDAELVGKVLASGSAVGADWQADQQSMTDFNAALTKAAGTRYVGLSVPEGATTYSTIVRLSGDEADRAVEDVAADAAAKTGTSVTVEYVDVSPLPALLDSAKSIRADVLDHGLAVGDVWVDERASQIVVEVSGESTEAQLAMLGAIVSDSGDPYRIVATDDVAPAVPYTTAASA